MFSTFFSKTTRHTKLCKSISTPVQKLVTFAKNTFLKSHFLKHQAEFKGQFRTPEDYLKGAQHVVSMGEKISYEYKDGKIHIGYFKIFDKDLKKQSYEFVGLNLKGNIATYHIRKKSNLLKLFKYSSRDKNLLTANLGAISSERNGMNRENDTMCINEINMNYKTYF